MCTVSYIPLGKDNFILTSNRDESPIRKTIPPNTYKEDGVELLYPKDELAGGTWIGLSEKKRLVCLLNGGFEKHQRNSYYKMSRGIFVKKLLTSENPIDFIELFDFKNIEPFTLILVDWNYKLKTFELVWDGTKRHFTILKQEPKIWSSSSLYNQEMKELRKKWFADWLHDRRRIKQSEIIEFHKNTKNGTPDISLKMKRPLVETVSITSVKKEKGKINLQYNDFLKNTFSCLEML